MFFRFFAYLRPPVLLCYGEILGCYVHQTLLALVLKPYMEDGVRLLEFAANARQEFEKQDLLGKRGLLKLVLSNSKFDNGKVSATFRKPFVCLPSSHPIR